MTRASGSPTVVGVILSNRTELLERYDGVALSEVTATIADRLRAGVRGAVDVSTHPGGLVAVVRPSSGRPGPAPADLEHALSGFVEVRDRVVWPVVTTVLRACASEDDLARALAALRSDLFAADRHTPGTARWVSEPGRCDADDRLSLVGDLATAVHGAPGQLGLAFQPVVDLRTGAVLGAEALLRWDHPERGAVPAFDAVDAAERSGLIHPLGRLVLDRALGQLAAWRAAGRDLTMHVNVSPHQLRRSDFADCVADLLHRYDLPPGAVLLELTESAVMGGDATIHAALDDLRVRGLRLGLDDFGTGYSSIGHLHELPVHTVKVDRSLVAGIGSSGASLDLLRAVVGLLDASAVGVVVEGVETAVQAAHARAIGCRSAQGYLFGRPGPASAFPRVGAREAAAVPAPRTERRHRTVA
jgi:EAL domain-containing protein (putative c-di-GMP-specific phosphodiesterase class I)